MAHCLDPDLTRWEISGHALARILRAFARPEDVESAEGVTHHALCRAAAHFRVACAEGEQQYAKALRVEHAGYVWVLNPIRRLVVTVRDLAREADPAHAANFHERQERWLEAETKHATALARQRAIERRRIEERLSARRTNRWYQPWGRGRRPPHYRPNCE